MSEDTETNSIEMSAENGIGTKEEHARRAELVDRVGQSYQFMDGKYRNVMNPVTETFTDHGNRLTTSSNSIETAAAMSTIADSRGWSSVRVAGSDAFYETSSDHFAWGTQVQVERAMTVGAKQVRDGIEISARAADHEARYSEPSAWGDGPEVWDEYMTNQNIPDPRKEGSRISAKAAELKQARDDVAVAHLSNGEYQTAEQYDNAIERKGKQSARFMGPSEREDWEARQLAARRRIEEQYRVGGKKGELFYKKDQRGMKDVLAFKVTARGAKTTLNDPRVIASMIEYEREVAGATKLHLTGHKDFRRMAWEESTRRGIETTGYKPSEIELQRMGAKVLGGEIVRTKVQGLENQRLVNDAIAERVDRSQQIPERQQRENQEEISL